MPQELNEIKAPFSFKRIPITDLEERKTLPGRLRVRGIFQKADLRNANNRVYPHSVWATNLSEDSDFMKRLAERRVLGELEHPESGNTHLKRISHLIEKIWMETVGLDNEYGVPSGEYVVGQSLIMDTPNGRILKELFDVGVPVGISSRGRGDVTVVGGEEQVQDNYRLDTFDFVSNASVVESRPRPIEEQEVPEPALVPGPEGGEVAPSTPEQEPGPGEPAAEAPIPAEKAGTTQERAADLVRALEDAIGAGYEVVELAELFTQGLDLLDELGSQDDPVTAKLRGQILTLSRALSKRIIALEGGGEKKKTKKEKETEEPVPEEGEVPVESLTEGLVEGTLEDAAETFTRGRESGEGPVFRGELENTLNQFGHETDDSSVTALASALRRRGFDVREEVYGESPERRSEDMAKEATATDVATHLAEQCVTLRQQLDEVASTGVVPRKRYDAAVKIAEGLLKKAREEKRVRETLEKRYEALVLIVNGLVERFKSSELRTYVAEQLKAHPELSKAEGLLMECGGTEAVDKRVVQLVEVAGTKPKSGPTKHDESLPPVTVTEKSQKLLEEAKAAELKETADEGEPALVTGAVKRLGGR